MHDPYYLEFMLSLARLYQTTNFGLDDKLNVTKVMIYVFAMVVNIMGKGENAGYQHFLLFPQCCQMPFSLRGH